MPSSNWPIKKKLPDSCSGKKKLIWSVREKSKNKNVDVNIRQVVNSQTRQILFGPCDCIDSCADLLLLLLLWPTPCCVWSCLSTREGSNKHNADIYDMK